MGHHLLHAPGLRCFSRSMTDKAVAEIVSLGFVLDEPTFYRIPRDGELHDFLRGMLKQRMLVSERFKI